MDEIELLRRVREDVAEPSAPGLQGARGQLVARASGATRGPRRRAPLLLAGAAALVAVVAVVAVGLVVSNPFTTAPATAASILQRAADRATADPVPGPGQYLAVETREDALGYVEGEGESTGVVGAYRFTVVSTTYVPEDRDGVWVRCYYTEAPTVFYGGAEVRAGAARDFAADAKQDDPGVERARGGAFGNGELGGGSVGVGTDAIPTLPRDPERLLRVLERSGGAGDDDQTAAVQAASGLLRSGLVPLDLRRALFEALALLPDVRIVDDAVSMSGRTGTAIGVQDGFSTQSVVIDRDTGDYLGQLDLQRRTIGAVPAGTMTDQTTIRTAVVDEVPGS